MLSRKFFIAIIAAVILILFLFLFGQEVKSFFYFLSSPFQKVLWKAGNNGSGFLEGILKAGSLKNRTKQLELEKSELLSELALLNGLKEENRILREALALGLKKDFKLSMAQIIGRDISQDFILIDKGSKDKISKNMPVVSQQKVLVGRISEVYEKFSKVMLISNKNSFFDGEILNKDIQGIVKGKGNAKLFLDLIPRDDEISQGDFIITSSLGGVFPKGLLVGEITNVMKNDVESIQQAEIKSALNIKDVDYLFIIIE